MSNIYKYAVLHAESVEFFWNPGTILCQLDTFVVDSWKREIVVKDSATFLFCIFSLLSFFNLNFLRDSS